MSDYIKREDAERTMYTFLKQAHEMSNDNERLAEVLTIAKNVVHEIPSADVAPVRHGRWEKEYGHYKCLLCNGFDDFADNYCPQCGARMDGEDDEID